MHIVADNKIPYLQGQAERLGTVVYKDGAEISADDLRNADALIIRTRTRCNRQLLEGSNVRFIATATIGHDHLDKDFLAKAGIAWSNCPGCNAPSVAQYVAASLLLLEEAGYLKLSAATIGIVGVGHVGSCVQKVVEKLGCRVLLCDPPRAELEGETGFCSLDEICEQADVVTFHTPLTTDGAHPTFHLADENFFAKLKHGPVIINSSRGEVVDTEALKIAMRQKIVRAAVIDTWENEPKIDLELLENVFIGTPHIAGYSADGKACGTRMALEAIARHFGIEATFDIQPTPLPSNYNYDEADPRPESSPLRFYHPFKDSRALKLSPDSFEYLRGHYPLRREMPE